jgi:antitoxin component of MazEF toxin-antitoxin module
MPTQKLKNKNVRKITKVGRGSLAVTLPKEYTTALKWKEKQKVVVSRVRGGLLVKDWKK